MTQTFILPPETRENSIERLSRFLHTCLPGKRIRVTVERFVKRRSNEQNAYLWGVVYPTIREDERFAGWNAETLHEWFLGDWGGWEPLVDFHGEETRRPVRRSSKLTTIEFMDFVAHIQQVCAEQGIYVPDPNEQAA